MSEQYRGKLRKTEVNEKVDRKCGLAEEILQPEGRLKKQNFKDKLSKFKFLEARGHRVILNKKGNPGEKLIYKQFQGK